MAPCAQVVQRAVQVAEGGNVRPVQPQEAAQGRIDYVKARPLPAGRPWRPLRVLKAPADTMHSRVPVPACV